MSEQTKTKSKQIENQLSKESGNQKWRQHLFARKIKLDFISVNLLWHNEAWTCANVCVCGWTAISF